ncbi:hypothetical protein MKW98_015401, partial [Papaver atlanticum]
LIVQRRPGLLAIRNKIWCHSAIADQQDGNQSAIQYTVKSKAIGIWGYKDYGKVKVGGAYTLKTADAVTVRCTIRRLYALYVTQNKMITSGSLSRIVGRSYYNIDLGFKTPREAIEDSTRMLICDSRLPENLLKVCDN